MSLLNNLNQYHNKPENAKPTGKINLSRPCETCGNNVPLNTGLFRFLPVYAETAPWYSDRIGKNVCFSCLPPEVQMQMSGNTVTASVKNSYIDELFIEIFKSEK